MIEFTLPSLGSDMDQGKLLHWHVAPGDAVRRGQVVAVVDTSKAAVDVESWQEGTVFELLVEPGETVPVGSVLATFLEAGESPETAPRHPKPLKAQPATATATAAAAPAPAAPGAIAAAPGAPGRRRSSPAARRRAEDLGIDLGTIAGTGPDGAITLQDVERAAAPAPAAAPLDRHAEMRKAIGAAMSRSKREIPHYYLTESVAMRKALDWLSAANAQRGIADRLLAAVLLLKAVALTLRDYPDLNGVFVDGAFRASAAVHVGVAISLRQGGLIAPALHDVAGKPLEQLMRELADLSTRARAGSLRSSEMSDPTITVTSLGERGVEAVHGVIYPPQVALVGFGRIAARPWVEDGGLFVMPAVTATLAADHRVSDGHYGALFLAALHERLQHPEQL
jgi:pyruvate dehydrogenase E2 component (dihydrolipoamide acetyltransferase)